MTLTTADFHKVDFGDCEGLILYPLSVSEALDEMRHRMDILWAHNKEDIDDSWVKGYRQAYFDILHEIDECFPVFALRKGGKEAKE